MFPFVVSDLSRHSGTRPLAQASDAQLRIGESITTIGSMDSGLVPLRYTPRNDVIPHQQILVRVSPDWRARLPAGWVRPSVSSARRIRRAAPALDPPINY